MGDEVFDADAIKADYLAKQHGISRADYLKDGLTDQQFITQYGDKPIGAPEAAADEDRPMAYQPSPERKDSNEISPWLGAGMGGAAGFKASKILGEGYAADAALRYAADKYLNPKVAAPKSLPSDMLEVPKNLPTTEFPSPELNTPVQEYYNEYGFGEPATKSAAINQDISKVHSDSRKMGTMGREAPLVQDSERVGNNRVWTLKGANLEQSQSEKIAARQAQLDKARQEAAMKIERERLSEAAKKEAQRAWLANQGAQNALNESTQAAKDAALKEGRPFLTKAGDTVSSAVNKLPAGLGKKLLNVAGPTVAGAASGAEAADAWNRYNRGDYLGAGLSGLGAAGSLAAAFPFQPPMFRAIEGGIGMGAPLLNTGLDWALGKDEKKPVHKAEGGPVLSYPMGGGLNYTMPGFAEGGSSDDAKNFQLSTGALEDLLAGNSDISHFLPQAVHDLTHMPKSIDPNNAEDLAMNFAGAGITKPFVNPGYNAFGELMSAKERLAEKVKQRLIDQYPTNTATDPIKKPFENTVQARNKSLINGSGPEPTPQDLRNDALIKRLQEQYGK